MKIRMRADERDFLRSQIVSFMEYHPLPAKTLEKEHIQKHVHIPYTDIFSYIHFTKFQLGSGMGVLLLVLLVGTPALAEKTVPGDILYPMKIRVNEEVLSQLSFTPYKKVAWETRRVERRIAEARVLAKEGKLTDAVEAQITATVKEHTATAQKELQALRESDADQAALAQVAVDSAFDVQSAVLDTTDASSSPGGEQILALAGAVRDAKATLAPSTDEPTSLSSYELFSGEVESATTRAHELFVSIKASIVESERDDLQRRLDDVDRRISDAHGAYEASSTSVAIQNLKDALSDTQKLISFMTNIDVRQVVSLETLVPKQLTLEERKSAVVIGRKEIAQKVAQVTGRLASSTDQALNTKVRLGLADVQKYAESIDSEMKGGGALDKAEGVKSEVDALLKDLLLMTADLGGVVMPIEVTEKSVISGHTVVGTSTLEVPHATTSTTSTDARSIIN